uniref:Uncharacterized protein n=1 Tax=Anguilla anguilla TaxID=7936 RepID=A0A0E9V6U4_ANGAN
MIMILIDAKIKERIKKKFFFFTSECGAPL